ncbi:16S rRNA (cytosine(967)-C(5))-methyltransferase RsmB [Salinisphaera sp. USBA-960]|uniref:16S rRNA (cytosine(967)-C(5))-methyltransferase RsmB n=1 Tax=Salinisphaera orenii TaxID=856731 RepID=UPI000DBE3198|nr:16S rRNA (cytosine(967)-C(5))-methyltransferase RsmB [Salifodinibacter halophilus]NNC25974.1 16S rRNA (cytosine(967)-C(5))-methyltransferase RsmB [Salifodinibacter halophilus]
MTEAASHSGALPRAAAARALSGVVDQGRSLDDVLPGILDGLEANDRALASMLARETVRWHRRLLAQVTPHLKNNNLQPFVRAIIEVGVWQLEGTRVPSHAAVSATVAAAKPLGVGRAGGLINAVLRNHQRSPVAIQSSPSGVCDSMPDWLLDATRADWPEQWCSVVAALNEPAPMWLRNNAHAQPRDALAAQLSARGMDTTTSTVGSDALRLTEPVAAETLPELAKGQASIQDIGAQLTADIVAPTCGDRILDACAAPGNKTAHLLARGAGEVVALDHDAKRLESLETNLARCGVEASMHTADATDPERTWWDGQGFDRVLIDAPCSGTGVIRRHPDIKWLRRASDIEHMAERQQAFLRALWPTLAPGGVLVYVTCSILRAEGVDVVARFMAEQSDAVVQPIMAEWGQAETVGRRLAPGEMGCDGFYYARLIRGSAV